MSESQAHQQKLEQEQKAIKSIQDAYAGGDPNQIHAAVEQDIPLLIAGYQRLKGLLEQQA